MAHWLRTKCLFILKINKLSYSLFFTLDVLFSRTSAVLCIVGFSYEKLFQFSNAVWTSLNSLKEKWWWWWWGEGRFFESAYWFTSRADLFEDETHRAFSLENSKFGFPILNGWFLNGTHFDYFFCPIFICSGTSSKYRLVQPLLLCIHTLY